MSYLIARKLNVHGDVDYLHAWDRKWVASFILGPKHAMKFEAPGEVLLACKKLETKLPTFMDGRPIEYLVIKSNDPRLN